MEFLKEHKILNPMTLVFLGIIMSCCSVSQTRQDICGTYVHYWRFGLDSASFSITLNVDSTFNSRRMCDSGLSHYDVKCTGTWSIVNPNYLFFDCKEETHNFSDSLSCVETNREFQYVNMNGEQCYVDGRLRIMRNHLKSHAYNKIKRIRPKVRP